MSDLTARSDDWIRANVENPQGQCAEITAAMAQAFHELRRVRGHYYCLTWGERAHWWLVAPDGTVVDPTAAQFPSRGLGHYEEWQEGAEEPVGRCANCGGEIYASSGYTDTVCSDLCARSYESYLMGGYL
jgi:hypothetical protein